MNGLISLICLAALVCAASSLGDVPYSALYGYPSAYAYGGLRSAAYSPLVAGGVAPYAAAGPYAAAPVAARVVAGVPGAPFAAAPVARGVPAAPVLSDYYSNTVGLNYLGYGYPYYGSYNSYNTYPYIKK
ncbi:hypothetical protein CDAR_73901 [Caerostris darwini]|uniref:Uncharacterized protein n=1 Tax=Caerostris darwini TaxID=1538125 RepID=A0AAV4MR07_9ARAC|nr:hypothetical protein CDAR_73901 [Caerostris darwini]